MQSFEDVQQAVMNAGSNFEASHNNQKTRKWPRKISTRMQFYRNIMDLLAQHNPGYVALAWGTMKFFFVVSCKALPKPVAKEIK